MYALPDSTATILAMFAPLFTPATFEHARLLLVGAILAPGRRTVTAGLRILGLADEPQFQQYHRVLNRAVWSSRQAAGVLVKALVAAFGGGGPLVFGIDETLERRRGAKIKAKGIYRDPVRSSHSHFVKASGLRWISLMLLAPIPWADRIWAFPFFTVLAPSERYHAERGLPHRSLADWARLMICQLRHWLPAQPLVVVADSTYAVLALLAACGKLTNPVTVVTRLRLDARLFSPPPPRRSGTIGRPRKIGRRQPSLASMLADSATTWRRLRVPRWYSQGPRWVQIASATALWYHVGDPAVPIRWVLIRDPKGRFTPQALLCTDLSATPLQILSWLIRRWQMETTFQAVRTHLGVETQRQWNDLAIARTTPVLLALFSLITLLAHPHFLHREPTVRRAAWYPKATPSFADAIACVRRQLWHFPGFSTSCSHADHAKLTPALHDRLVEALCYAA